MTSHRRDLSDEECRRLVAGARVGHLAFTRDALPAVVPVRYVVDGDRLAVPAHPGDDHLLPHRGGVVVLCVDQFDGDHGWAVSVVGPARTVTDPASVEAWDAAGWPRDPVPGDGHGYVVLQATILRGWRVLPVAAPAEQRPA
ncbi:Pyridoxamine 5'-phosphate oxidase [Geodermatophilus saharensis]|uniref:Pyridoxamine 5'-phosphate oxidase n=1 Tax=Geodermatophilus saharensis TaxID=1137994 RepID=A0A239BTQ7_9ACTN|nr:pyridoxamine 5'-phosphate oxidase family protein [Geodermatophilus saharensis]SNS11049.1 Pyridoxamine 5'-phosphate oxidase [Geodermatophilus saharensis]